MRQCYSFKPSGATKELQQRNNLEPFLRSRGKVAQPDRGDSSEDTADCASQPCRIFCGS